MKDKKETNTKEKILPLITLRGLTITPNSNVQILASRTKSIAAFESAKQSDDKEIAIFCQLYDEDEEPESNRLLQIGVLCKVLSGEMRDQDTYRCLIRGKSRIKIVRIIDNEGPFRKVVYEDVEEELPSENDQKQIVEAVQSALAYAVEHSSSSVKYITDSSVPKDLVDNLKKEKDLSILVDTIGQIIIASPAEKRAILATTDVKKRAYLVLTLLNNYSYKAELDAKIAQDARDSIEKNQKEYYLQEQLKSIKKELNSDGEEENDINEYRRQLRALKAPAEVEQKINKEIRKLSLTGSNNSESNVIRNYIETLLSVPWNKKTSINKDIEIARETLDKDHYGLKKVKEKILEYLAVQSRADHLHGPILCLVGPPGIGKTSLAASIAKATGRKYARVALGGLHDESEIRGHRRTYVGSMPGKIIQSFIKVGVNNPLFLLDEIDKVSVSNHGDPSAALLEVLDPEQNVAFNDNYIEVDYDLSNAMFLATANSYNIPAPLLDRMEIIDLSSYTEEEKIHIAKEHLIPKQMRLNTLTAKEFEIKDDALVELIRYYTHEAGVRNLERRITEICRKVVKDILTAESLAKKEQEEIKEVQDALNNSVSLAESTKDMLLSLDDEESTKSKSKAKKATTTAKKKKHIITIKKLHDMLGPRRYDFTSKLNDNKVGIVNGLAWTSLGGDILQIEAVAVEGTGKHKLTGKLGDVMKESISAATTVVRTIAKDLKLKHSFYEKSDIHIHVPDGATPKDGPSAGIGMVTAIVSAITGNKIKSDVAMTGEITLRGDVLAIGGLKEKLLAALRGGIKIAIIPKDNEKDLWDIPDNVKKGLKIIPVSHISDVLPIALEK